MGDFDYETKGHGYALRRRPDPRIAATIHAALGDAGTVLNVGAGAGSYEPSDRYVVAVEPSARMRAQRPADAVPALHAVAEQLPFDDDAFDAVMATITVHQWADTVRGLTELRRVARGPVVVLTFDGDALDRLWLAEYAPEVIATERRRYPAVDLIAKLIGDTADVIEVPIPIDCVDGFNEAFYARPEQFLDPRVRAANSAWGFVDEDATARAVDRLRADLESGAWDVRHGHLRTQPQFDGSLRLIVGPAQGRQIRVRGPVRSESADRSAADFLARPPGSRAEASIGRQSQPLPGRRTLDTAVEKAARRIADDPDFVVPQWTLHTLDAYEAEFWQADKQRKHTRLRYTRADTGWTRELLWP